MAKHYIRINTDNLIMKAFSDAFEKARGLVTEWEDKEKYDHSDPQFWSADKIEQHLSAWRAALPEHTALNP